jgi:hypothetical protein
MAYSAQRGRKLAHRQIKRLGGRRGTLLRDNVPIPITLRVLDYSARASRGDLVDPLARRCLISTFTWEGEDMLVRPDKETDTIIVYTPGDVDADSPPVEETIRIISRPLPIEVAGTVVLWDLQVLQ